MKTRPMRRDVLKMVSGVSALAAIGGCTSIVSRPSPVKATFLLDPPLPPALPSPAKSSALRVGAINVAAPFRGKNFVFRRSDLGYESDYYDEFFVPPSIMLADATAKALASANVFKRVVPAGAAGNEGDYLLEGFVSELYGDARTSTRSMAVLTVTFYLTSMSTLGSAPVWTHEYRQQVELSGSTSQALADGLNRALGSVLAELARDLASAALPG